MSKKLRDNGWCVWEERNEMMKLTKVAKSWEFTCSFCFKKFPSAQAMGGHQNAHRRQRLEEKRLSVRDPIAYRKRAFLRAIKGDDIDHHHQDIEDEDAGSTSPNFNDAHAHAPPYEYNPPIVINNAAAAVAGGGGGRFCKDSSSSPPSEGDAAAKPQINMMMSAAVEEEEEEEDEVGKGKAKAKAKAKGKAMVACTEFDVGCNLDHNLDLTLKL